MKIESIYQKLDLSKLDCFYADIRLEEEAGTEIGFKNGQLDSFAPSEALGAFLSVYNNGKWFYRSLTDLDQIESGFEALIQQSRAYRGVCKELFAAVPKEEERILRFASRDPRAVSLEAKRELCESYLGVTAGVGEMKEFRVYYKDRIQNRAFKSSRGRSFLYDYVDYGLYAAFVMRDGAHFFTDFYKAWSQDFEELKGRESEMKAFLEEGRKHLRAPAIAPGKYPVVMNSDVVGVFTHESFGHKSEADFMMGDEAARSEWKIGARVAAECVSIVDDGAAADNSGYCPIDDEGMPSSKTYLIKNGLLQGRLHSLGTANEFGERPTGNARAINFEFEPIVRMTNTYIEPGEKTPEELIASVKNGVYVSDYRHGSGLSTFTIAPTRAYWIRDGKLAEPVKVPVISGTVFETLNKISGVSRSAEIHSSAFGGCGKDEQWPLRVADGGPVMLVDEMQVG